MRTTAILNLKGGVGKTVTAINMAAVLAGDHKRRVLVIDADSQANLTEFFAAPVKGGDLAQLLKQNIVDNMDPGLHIRPTSTPGVDLIAGTDELMDLDLTKVSERKLEVDVLRRFLELVREDYDFVIIDCPPAFSAATAAALVAADDVVIPMKLDAFSIRGMANLLAQVNNMRRINPRLRVAGVLRTMVYRNVQLMAASLTLQSSALPVFRSVIRRSAKVDDMTFAQTPLREFSPRSGSGKDYRAFVAEYMGGEVNG